VAKKFGKDHKNVLRDIRNLECSEDFRRLNFELFKIRDLSKPEGESTSHVEMTRDGLAFLVMGFTGAKAARWKELDIEAFNRMEAQLRRGGSDVLDKVATMLARGIVETEARTDRVARQVNERVDHLEEQVASLSGRLASARLVSARQSLAPSKSWPTGAPASVKSPANSYAQSFKTSTCERSAALTMSFGLSQRMLVPGWSF